MDAAIIRAVVDTNVFVSGLINPHGPPGKILNTLRAKRFTLVTSPEINEEILEVLDRPHIRDKYGLGNLIFDVAFILWEVAEQAADLPPVTASPDPDDNKFLSAAIGGHAQYLVTGDSRDLLALEEHRGVRILKPAEFAKILLKPLPPPRP